MNKSTIKKIFVISLSNIGDVVLTFPVMDILKQDFPEASLSVVIGPKAESLVMGNPNFDKVYVYDKHQIFTKTLSWMGQLRRERFDLVVDLKNTAIPFVIFPRYRTSCFTKKNEGLHMRQKHLDRLKSVYPYSQEALQRYALSVSDEDKNFVTELIQKEIGSNQRYVIFAPGAANWDKRWTQEGFAQVADQLVAEHQVKIIFVGNEKENKVAQSIAQMMDNPSANLCGRLNLIQLAEVITHCCLAVVNDSAPMHLASYLNKPVVALFGPSDPKKYGPWSAKCRYIKNPQPCAACAHAKSAAKHTCMQAITSEEVMEAVRVIGL